MSMDANRWVNTLNIRKESYKEEYKLDSNRWLSTLPYYSKKNINNPNKKYSLGVILLVIGLVLVSIIKNETRNLEKEIRTLQASINNLNFNLYQATLDHEVITSPENISRLAGKYLEPDFVYYKRSQIKHLNENEKILTKLEKIENKKIFGKNNVDTNKKIKLRVVKKIEATKTELKKLQELYSAPEELPSAIRNRVAKKIEDKKNELKMLYSDPYDLIKTPKMQRWLGLQVVKVFLGIPIIPGK